MCSLAAVPAPKYVPFDAAARFAGLSIRTLERRVASGQLGVYHVGRRRLVELDQVDQLVRAGRVAS
jgi:excisionase family DNA binding protein